ncbi:MAG: DUF350 domain-containing protein [Alphaproteobacteria bacterium]
MDLFSDIRLAEVIATVFYTLLGLGLFILSYIIIDKITHFSLHEEIAEKKNVAVAILIGSVAISLAILISSVIRS